MLSFRRDSALSAGEFNLDTPADRELLRFGADNALSRRKLNDALSFARDNALSPRKLNLARASASARAGASIRRTPSDTRRKGRSSTSSACTNADPSAPAAVGSSER